MSVYELRVRRTDGSRYVEASLRADEPDARNRLDREALHWLPRPGVLEVSVEEVDGRTGGYRRERRNG